MAVLSDVFGLLLGATTTARQAVSGARASGHPQTAPGLPRRTLIYGAGWAGVIVARSALRDPTAGIVPVGFLDDDRSLQGTRALGLPIFGDLDQLDAARRRTRASSVLITLPYASGQEIRRVVDAAIRQGLSVHTIPAATELIDGAIDASHARPLQLEDFHRGPVVAPSPALCQLVEDRTVMVIGAGGRVGSPLARCLLPLRPSRIVLVDEAERGLRVVSRRLQRAYRVAQGSTVVTSHLLDATRGGAVSELVGQMRPTVVLHVVAVQQWMAREDAGPDVVRGNIEGTRTLIEAAVQSDVQRFVHLSPDYSLEGLGLAGLSTRIAEIIVNRAAHRTGRPFASVRVGRLSEPSRVPIEASRSSLQGDQPLVVDASQRRRPMVVEEVARIILEAAALEEPGSVYRIDRGAPVRAGDLVRDELRLLGHDVDAMSIKIVGRPPDDVPRRQRDAITAVPGLSRVASVRSAPVTFDADVERFVALAQRGQDDQLRAELARYLRFMDSAADAYHDQGGPRPAVAVPVTSSESNGGRQGDRLWDPHPSAAVLLPAITPRAGHSSATSRLRARHVRLT